MSRKVKITGEEKAEIARRVAAGELGSREAARQVGVDQARIREWKNRYEAQGVLAFRETEDNQVYSQETKKMAVEDYLGGKGSLQIIAAKYGLRSETTLRAWIKVYNSGKDFSRKMIKDYILYYNTKRLQRNLGILTPLEKYQLAMAA